MTTKEKQQELIKYIQEQLNLPNKHCQCCGNVECDYSTTGCPWYIGKELTLSDVLRVIGKKTDKIIYIDSDGYIDKFNCKWNLEKDFNNQSEEFYNWLYDLLIKNSLTNLKRL